MSVRYADLRRKEVVNVNDGRRLGLMCDMILDPCRGCIEAIVVPGSGGGLLGIFKGSNEIVIPWGKICRFGEDIVLVDIECLPERR